MAKGVQERHGRASWLASREISGLEVAGLRVRGCRAVVLPHVGAGLVGSEWLKKCQASQPRVGRWKIGKVAACTPCSPCVFGTE